MPRVLVNRDAERLYIRRALRRYPKEYIEILWGKRHRNGDICIVAFVPIDHKAAFGFTEYISYSWVEDEDEDRLTKALGDGLDDHAEHAAECGLIVLGKIHTHPYHEPGHDDMPSYGDLQADAEEGVLVTGICRIEKNKQGRKATSVGYWPILRKYETVYK